MERVEIPIKGYCRNGDTDEKCEPCRLAVVKIRKGDKSLTIPDSLGDGCNTQRMIRYHECEVYTIKYDDRVSIMEVAAHLHHIDVASQRSLEEVVRIAKEIEDERLARNLQLKRIMQKDIEDILKAFYPLSLQRN